MYVYVCIYVVSIDACMYLCMYACVYVYYSCTYLCMHVCMYVCIQHISHIIHVRIYVCMYVYTYVCISNTYHEALEALSNECTVLVCAHIFSKMIHLFTLCTHVCLILCMKINIFKMHHFLIWKCIIFVYENASFCVWKWWAHSNYPHVYMSTNIYIQARELCCGMHTCI
jgi:hypothetical protein